MSGQQTTFQRNRIAPGNKSARVRRLWFSRTAQPSGLQITSESRSTQSRRQS